MKLRITELKKIFKVAEVTVQAHDTVYKKVYIFLTFDS